MFKNSSNLMFIFMLIFSTFICISSNSWLGVWIGLEMNLLSFIPLMNNNFNSLSNEASLKYFLIQAIASILLLFLICINFINWNFFSMIYYNNIYLIFINFTLLLKMGAAPFHFWFPSVMDNMNWMNNFILMTWQKINPFICLSYCINMKFILVISIFSIFIGSLGGINSSSFRKIMAFSSISHIGWMLMSMTFSESNFMFYFTFYSLISFSMLINLNLLQLNNFNQMLNNSINSMTKISIFIILLSMGGLPPFLGFFPKWIIIESLINMNMYIYILMMIMMTLFTLFFYLRLSFTLIIINNFQMYWKYKINYPQIISYVNYISMMFFPMILFLFML
uniref:NADH dehydrogenase subunit 2 n=1 Tax=Ctenophthalmus yunnanus TaxID=3104523 RepID=UPI002E7A7358|nr:NADH dehydrogenase subunit 2 [Ctenophthalmus yunnanus]WPS93664.1 NADH dehydrogenase subunit 2 [Ctenophthalmus yunnanus]